MKQAHAPTEHSFCSNANRLKCCYKQRQSNVFMSELLKGVASGQTVDIKYIHIDEALSN